MKTSIIAAIARNGALGVSGDMVYHISDDLRRFKRLTLGKPVIMGRRTWESLPGGALPGRRNIVITTQKGYEAPGAETVGSLEDAIDLCKQSGAQEAMIIGGGRVYADAMPLADRLLLTLIDDTPEKADTFFPEIDPEEWQIEEQEEPMTDAHSGLKHRFICLSRK